MLKLKLLNSKNWSVKYQNVKNVNEEVNKTNINNHEQRINDLLNNESLGEFSALKHVKETDKQALKEQYTNIARALVQGHAMNLNRLQKIHKQRNEFESRFDKNDKQTIIRKLTKNGKSAGRSVSFVGTCRSR